jgi:hypothetical protein
MALAQTGLGAVSLYFVLLADFVPLPDSILYRHSMLYCGP